MALVLVCLAGPLPGDRRCCLSTLGVVPLPWGICPPALWPELFVGWDHSAGVLSLRLLPDRLSNPNSHSGSHTHTSSHTHTHTYTLMHARAHTHTISLHIHIHKHTKVHYISTYTHAYVHSHKYSCLLLCIHLPLIYYLIYLSLKSLYCLMINCLSLTFLSICFV